MADIRDEILFRVTPDSELLGRQIVDELPVFGRVSTGSSQTGTGMPGAMAVLARRDAPVMDSTTALLNTATAQMQRYKAGKAQLEARIVDNEEWFRQQHWRQLRKKSEVKQTGWLYAAVVNKHADYMDNKPEVNILAREEGDQKTAEALTKIMPEVLRRAGWDDAYSDACWDKIKFGAGIYAVLWDPSAEHGLGQVAVRTVDALNLFWEPGVQTLEDSPSVYLVELVDAEVIRRSYPQAEGIERVGTSSVSLSRYRYDESIDTTGKCAVVNWYYKADAGDGRQILHYCRYVDDVLLYASEQDPAYAETGWYADGRYPFVIDSFFPDKGTPHGFGTIDAMRETQEDIDLISGELVKNTKQALRRRYFSSAGGGINEAEFADLDRDIVHTSGQVSDQFIREITSNPVAGNYLEFYNSKINEIKENSFNRDVNAGGSSGTQTAAGIAALQESGSKSSRDAIGRTYKAFERVCDMVIERMRQFYTVPRYFRILGDDRKPEYVSFDNSALTGQPIGDAFGLDFGSKEPGFDLDVKVSKQNVWSRQAQNQDVISFYNMGFFDPGNSTQALACLEVLDIDNKERLREVIRRNGLVQQFTQSVLPALLQTAAQVNPALYAAAMQAATAAGLASPPPVMGAQEAPMDTGGRRAAPETGGESSGQEGMERSNSYMERRRAEAASKAAPR